MKFITGILFLCVFAVSGLSAVKDANAGGLSCFVDYVYTGPPSTTHANCRVIIHTPTGAPLNSPGEAPLVDPEIEKQCDAFKEEIKKRLLQRYASHPEC